MNRPRYRAWRFVHPELDRPQDYGGLMINPQGGITMVEGSDSIRQSILLLLSTIPGERVMRPDYGSHLHLLLFAPNDATTAGLAIHYVRRSLERWEPRIDILRVDANQNLETPELLEILLEYRVKATQNIQSLSFSIDLTQ